MISRFLTKSRFKTALECPTKLFYMSKEEFANSLSDDAFMAALADGGFQVGELAKLMYPGGIEVVSKNHAEALAQTAQLLERDEVIIFEGALSHGSLFVRVDIMRKNGSAVDLIEVKAKSYGGTETVTNTAGGIRPAMLPYLQDVAFQTHVLHLAYPQFTAAPYLLMADKNARATVDQLNQKFKITRNANSHRVEIAEGTSKEAIGAPLLTHLDVGGLVEQILQSPVKFPGGELPFADAARHFAAVYSNDARPDTVIGAHCLSCEFKSTNLARSGFHACWKQATGWRDADFDRGTVLDLWNFRGKNDLIQRGIFALDEVTQGDLKYAEDGEKLIRQQRQWMQVSGEWPGGGDYYLNREGIRRASANWKYPLHFIDFETSRTAIPFHIGRRPYEQVAFQFSHHLMTKDGTVTHAGQFIEAAPGVFPNYAFVRELSRQVGNDEGTILRWASHENSVLRDIWQQLEEDTHPPSDKADLQNFILDVTTEKNRVGRRTMVDLCKMAEHYYFHPLTNGSCSIKKVLPAVFLSSDFIRNKYSKANYGSPEGCPSLNFTNWSWWRTTGSTSVPMNPYALLSLADSTVEGNVNLEHQNTETLADGGAAMTTYGRLQFELLGDAERSKLVSSLLRYCELDTLAMVMIWEAWQQRQ